MLSVYTAWIFCFSIIHFTFCSIKNKLFSWQIFLSIGKKFMLKQVCDVHSRSELDTRILCHAVGQQDHQWEKDQESKNQS